MKKGKGIRKIQKEFLDYFLEGDTKGNISASAERTGVTRQTVHNWLRRDEKFRDYIARQGDACKTLIAPHAWESLKRNVIQGDTPSIALYFKLIGQMKGDASEVKVLFTPAEREGKVRSLSEALSSFVAKEPLEKDVNGDSYPPSPEADPGEGSISGEG